MAGTVYCKSMNYGEIVDAMIEIGDDEDNHRIDELLHIGPDEWKPWRKEPRFDPKKLWC